MKKLVALLLIAMMVLSMAACEESSTAPAAAADSDSPYAALEAVGQSDDHAADAATNKSLGLKCIHKNCFECGQNSLIVDADDHQTACNEQHNHKGDDFFCNIGNSLQTAQGDQGGQRHDDNTDDNVIQRNPAEYFNRGEGSDIKGNSHICYDLVYLTHRADTEGSQHSENAEQNG